LSVPNPASLMIDTVTPRVRPKLNISCPSGNPSFGLLPNLGSSTSSVNGTYCPQSTIRHP
jgi:hypothetical protein